MAITPTQASLGHNDEFWFHNGTALTELVEVKAIGFPEPETDEIDATHLKSEGIETIPGTTDFGEFTVTMNYVAGSATDVLCEAARMAKDTRDWKIGVTDRTGTVVREYTGKGWVKRYRPDDIETNALKTATLVIRVTGAVTAVDAP